MHSFLDICICTACLFVALLTYIRFFQGPLACWDEGGGALSIAIGYIVVLRTGELDLSPTICSQWLGSFGDVDDDDNDDDDSCYYDHSWLQYDVVGKGKEAQSQEPSYVSICQNDRQHRYNFGTCFLLVWYLAKVFGSAGCQNISWTTIDNDYDCSQGLWDRSWNHIRDHWYLIESSQFWNAWINSDNPKKRWKQSTCST